MLRPHEEREQDVYTARLIHAARVGDLPTVREMFGQAASDVDFVDRKTGETAFSAALTARQLHICEYLMRMGDYGLGSCIVDGIPQSTFVTAVRQGDVSFVRRFLARRVFQSMPLSDPVSCVLSTAIEHGSSEMIDVLLDAGVPFHAFRSQDHFTVDAHAAITNENLASTERLPLQRLCIACWRNDLSWVKCLLANEKEQRDPHKMQTNAANALFLAAYKQSEEIVTELLDHGAKLDSVGANGVTAMLGAVQENSFHTLRFLLDQLDERQISCSFSVSNSKSLLVSAVAQCNRMRSLSVTDGHGRRQSSQRIAVVHRLRRPSVRSTSVRTGDVTFE